MAAQYAMLDDYELRTGQDVPPEMEPTIQQRLDDASALIELYLGDCADEVATAYPDILTALTCSHVYRASSTPPGVRSETVGGTSVSYADPPEEGVGLSSGVTDVLDELMDKCCGKTSGVPGLGSVGATWGGGSVKSDTAWMRDVDVWVM